MYLHTPIHSHKMTPGDPTVFHSPFSQVPGVPWHSDSLDLSNVCAQHPTDPYHQTPGTTPGTTSTTWHQHRPHRCFTSTVLPSCKRMPGGPFPTETATLQMQRNSPGKEDVMECGRRLPAGTASLLNCSRCAWRQDHSSVTHVRSASPPLGRTAGGICQWTLGGSMVQDGIPVSWLHAGPAPTLARTQGVN